MQKLVTVPVGAFSFTFPTFHPLLEIVDSVGYSFWKLKAILTSLVFTFQAFSDCKVGGSQIRKT